MVLQIQMKMMYKVKPKVEGNRMMFLFSKN